MHMVTTRCRNCQKKLPLASIRRGYEYCNERCASTFQIGSIRAIIGDVCGTHPGEVKGPFGVPLEEGAGI